MIDINFETLAANSLYYSIYMEKGRGSHYRFCALCFSLLVYYKPNLKVFEITSSDAACYQIVDSIDQ